MKHYTIYCLLSILFLLQSCEIVYAQCPPEGDSKDAKHKLANTKKNRLTIPKTFDTSFTWDNILKGKTFDETKSGAIEGWIAEIKSGGSESCNCHSKTNLDTHIVVVQTAKGDAHHGLIIEVTPRLKVSIDKKSLVGKHVKVTGAIFEDWEHKQNSFTQNPKGTNLWRLTDYELHPVSKVEIEE